jgi:hypothetical protein
LPIFPNIVTKASDLVAKQKDASDAVKKANKKNFKVYLYYSKEVKREQLKALGIKKVIIVDGDTNDNPA